MSNPAADEASLPGGGGSAETNRPVTGRQPNTSAPRLSTLQNAVLTAGVVFMIAVWIAAGLAFVDSFRNPTAPRPAPSAADESPTSLAEKSPPAVAEKS